MTEHTSSTPQVPGEDEISLLDLALVMAENLRLLVFVPLVAGLIALGISFTMTPTFTATTRIMPLQSQQSVAGAIAAQLGAITSIAGTASGIKNPADQYVAMLKSRTIADAMIQRFKLKEVYKVERMMDARQRLASATNIGVGAKDGIITIDVHDTDPQVAAQMANAYVEEFRELIKTLAITEAGVRRVFFKNQLAETKDGLVKAETTLRASGISEDTLKTAPQSVLESLAQLRAQITAQEIRIASMRTSMTEANPMLRVAFQELAALRAELAKAERSTASKGGGGDGKQYVTAFREFKYYETLYDLMSKQYELARIDEARDGAIIQVLDVALPPEWKSHPKKAAIAVVTTLGVFTICLILVFLGHALRYAGRDSATAEKLQRLRTLFPFRWLRLGRSR